MLNLDQLKDFIKKGIPFEEDICTIAAENGQLDCLIFVRQNGGLWNEETCAMAAKNGQLVCLK
jgi:hypothetical protein